jgi:hypothetical protein
MAPELLHWSRMKALPSLVHSCCLIGITLTALSSVGCVARVRERPAVVRVDVPPPHPVVEERVIVRP